MRRKAKIKSKHYVFNAQRCEYEVITDVVNDEFGWKILQNYEIKISPRSPLRL